MTMTKLEAVSADDSDSEVPRRSWRSFYKTNYTSKKSPRKFEDREKLETSPLFFQKWGKPIGFGGGILLLLLLIEIANLRREVDNLKGGIGGGTGTVGSSNPPNEVDIKIWKDVIQICDQYYLLGKHEAVNLICQMANGLENDLRNSGSGSSLGYGSRTILSNEIISGNGSEIPVLPFSEPTLKCCLGRNFLNILMNV